MENTKEAGIRDNGHGTAGKEKKAGEKKSYAPHGSLIPPLVLGFLAHKARNLRLDISRRDGVGSRKPSPLHRQTPAKVNDGRLARIVHSLQLRDVDDASAHGRRGDEASRQEILQRLAIQRGALLLLSSKVRSRALGTPHDAVDIDSHDLARCLGAAVDKGAFFPRDARVGNEDV